jgi:hypothetical protein
MFKRLFAALLFVVVLAAGVSAATLLPLGELQFFDNNGAPLAGGHVYFYVPNTLVNKDTYQNSAGTVLNSNPVTLDSAGRAIIYGAGAYREIVRDFTGNTIWDQITADTSATSYSWAGTSGGTANAQTLTAANFALTDGQIIGFIAGYTNTGALTLTVNGGSPLNVVKPTGAGPVALTGGDVVLGNQYQVTYSATNGNFQLVAAPAPTAFPVSGLTGLGAGVLTALEAAANSTTGFLTFQAPQIVVNSPGTSGIYTTPTGARWLEITMLGGGSGGGGGSTTGNSTTGTAGNASTFGSATAAGGAGAGATGSAAPTPALATGCTGGSAGALGNYGQTNNSSVNMNLAGGVGAASFDGGGGYGGGNAAVYGAGGGGQNITLGQAAGNGGAGGNAGAYCYLAISSPAVSYSFAVGAPVSGAFGAGAGAGGVIQITAHFQ